MKNVVDSSKKIYIVGAGGLGKEVYCALRGQFGWDNSASKVIFAEEDSFFKLRKVLGVDVISLSDVDPMDALILIAIGDIRARERISSSLVYESKFAILLDQSVNITPFTSLGDGSIVLGPSFLSVDVKVGKHAVINPGTTISHDCTIGNFFTASPGVNVSGGCKIGDRVFMGTNSCVRNGVTICDDAIIGMGSVVTKDILSRGTYIGNPAKSIIHQDEVQ
ncbi:MAG: acetyltransferase [Saprospiraceae bacterium]|uniref:Acetyltransferase n=1 Tax=Candidatus Opimibacter skivensis TaxID=2982028 RepID=A0A9D7SVW6_9BACT|nr:acetyltransferase [Candidatus Opimibacter skivensis]